MSLKIDTKVLDDLCSRFLLNIPDSEKQNMNRLCFQIELAHWFYLDFFRPENPSLPDCRMKEFAKLIFEEYPFLLNPNDVDFEEVFEKWKDYKRSVPTFGAILLDSTLEHVLLVQGFWIKASWGFPKGKVNKAETPEACAAREVLEETGYDITGKIDKTQYAEHHLNEQLSRLYFVTDVPMHIAFKPKTRGEIKNVQWFCIDDLPAHKKDTICKRNLNMSTNCFFMVLPFIKQMRRWVAGRKALLPLNNLSEPNHKPSEKATKVEDRKPTGLISDGNAIVAASRTSTHTTALGANKVKSESAKRQAQQFGLKNSQELEAIKNLTKEVPQVVTVKSSSPQQKRKVYGRGRGERLFRPHLIDFASPSTERRKGRALPVNFVPEAWKNFTFNREALLQAILSDNKHS